MMTNETATLRLNGVAHHAVAVQVAKQEKALIVSGEVIAIVDGQAAVCMAATRFVGALRLDDAALNRTVQDRAREVCMIGNGLDIVVGERVKMLSGLTLVAAAGEDVIKMWDDARGDEHLTMLVVIETPRVARAFGEDFELLGQRMQTPHTGIDALALGIRGAGLTDVGMGEDAVTAIEPTIGTPRETIQRLVRVLHRPAIEDHPWLAGLILRILRNEKKFRGGSNPDTAVTDLDTAHEIKAFVENRRLTVRTVAQRVF